jgi:hypothetical protein
MILPMRKGLTMSRVIDRRIYCTKNSQYKTFVLGSRRSLPPVVLRNRVRCTCQVQGIVVVASSIANIVHRISLASIDMVLGESEIAGSELLWSFDKRSAKPSFDV